MDKKKIGLEYYAKIKTDVNSIKDFITDLKSQLDTLELPKEATKNFEKSFSKITKNIDEFETAARRGIDSLSDTKTLSGAWKQIVRDLDSLEATIKGIDTTKIFPKEILANIKKADDLIDKYLKKLEETKSSEKYKNKTKARDDSREQESMLQKEKTRAVQDKAKKEAAYNVQAAKWNKQTEKTYQQQLKDIKDLNDKLEKQKKITEGLEKKREAFSKQGYITGKGEISKIKLQEISKIEDQGERAAEEAKVQEAEKILRELKNSKSTEKDFAGELKGAKEAIKENQELKESIDKAESAFKDAGATVDQYEKQLADAKLKTASLDAELKDMAMQSAKEQWKALIEAIEKYTDIDFSETTQEIEKIQEAMANYKLGEFKKIPGFIDDLKASFQSTEKPIQNMEDGLDDAADRVKEFDRAAQDIENLKNQVLDFFSISNTIQLFKRALQSALETVKELDAVMTETAVVTDFSIGDMWEKLPQYAKQATKLGTSIASLYEATTLYYQQGLQTNEAMGVGIETMKMARIANMDATDATTAMTAALRGFNMEVNEMNAQRVNDVYSELAAITAADTSQIATAMGKTASIAASANMEFETTAAFLAQIIETTQEAPETAGTAMKTIIARFTEVKELFSEGMLTGEDEEGEEININKIDAALRSVGISLKDFLNGSKGIDEIFLELASKWDSLDLATQRYIATAAAGSRQQSRFLAMMSNYGRTMELVTAANNSAGASQEQFDKTTESLEAKLQKLKNAWDTFVMGLANDEFLKGAVDALTFLLEQLNNLINLLSNGEGAQKSILSLVAAFAGLKVGGAVFNSIFIGLKDVVKNNGELNGKVFADSFKGSIGKNFGKTGEYLKGFFPSKNDWKSLIGKPLKEININDIIGGKANGFKDSLMKDFSEALSGPIKVGDTSLQVSQKSIDNIKAQASKLWESGDQQGAIQLLDSTLSQYNKTLVVTEQTAKQTTSAMQQGFGKAAGTAMALTGVLNLLSSILKNTGAERAAEGFSTLANGLSITAGLLTTLPALLKVVGITASSSLGWIGLIAGTVVSLGFAIAKWHESSSERMERLQKEADEAADAAQKAKESYDTLFSTKNEYNDMQKGLEDLIKGTDEWRKKLVEANQQVLQLLETYPELAKYVERGEGGQLAIGEAGWKALESQLEQQVTNTQAMSTMANMVVAGEKQESKKQNNQIFYKYKDGERYYDEQAEALILKDLEVVLGAQRKAVNKKMFDEELTSQEKENLWNSITELRDLEYNEDTLSDYLENHSFVNMYNEKFAELAKSAGLVADELFFSSQKISDYNSFMQKEGLIEESKLATYLGSSEIASSSKYGEQIARGIAKQNVWDIDDEIEERAKALKEEKNEADLKEQYKSLTGKEAKGMSETDLANAIAKIEIGNELSDQVDTIIQYLDNMGKDNPTAKKIAALISGDPSTLTRADIENVKKLDEDTKQALAEAQGAKNFDELAKSKGFEDEKEYEAHLLENWQDLISKFDELTTEGLEKVFGTEWDKKQGSVMQNATYNQEKAYTDLIAQILGEQGVEGAKSFVKTFNGILQDENTREQILSALNTYDFKREGAAEDFISYLKEIGVTIPESEIEEFTEDLKALGAAFRKFDLKTVSEEVKKVLDFADDLENRDGSKGFTDEEKAVLIKNAKAKEEDFVWTGQEWTYLGGTMESLQKAIEDNTSVILEEKREGLREQIDTGKEFEEKVKDGKVSYETGYGWLAEGGWGKTQKTFTTTEFFGGKDNGITKTDIEGVLGQTFLTEEEAWAAFDKYKFAYENLDINRVTEANWDSRYGSVADMQKNAQQIGGFIDNNASFTQEETDALAALAKQYGVSRTAIEKFRNAMNSTNEAEKRAAAMHLRNLTSQKQSEKQYGKTLKKLQEVNEEYNHITEDMPEYEEAATKYGEALGLDMTDTTNLEYIKDNMDLVRQAAEGNIESIQQLNEELAAEHGLKITAEGNFEPYNEAVLESDALIQDFIAKQLEAGAFELETIEAEQNVKYLVPKEGGGFEYKTFTQGQVVQIVKPKAAESIANSIRQAGGSSGGGGGGSTKKWENPYDEFYNTVAKINEELRKREQLERQYQRLLNRSTATAQKLSELAHEQVASLELELNTRQGLLEGRERQMKDIESEYSDVGQYASYNEESKQIVIDWELIQGLDGSENEELTSRIEEFISKLEEQEELIEQEVDAIEEIQDTVWEIQQQGKDEYFDLEEKIKEAIVTARQNEIDKLSEINETISDSDAEIIEAMQKSIEKYRQDRENQDTEEQLAEKQRRLLYLQQDTSGANAMEILKLQDEIEKGQQDYTDSLIDQKISELQEQNDEAAKQREKQIKIAQLQLDRYVESGAIWSDVYKLMYQGLNGADGLIRGSELHHLLQTSVGFDGMSVIGQQDWYVELNKQIAQALSYLETGRQIENLGITEGAEVEFIHNGQVLKGIANAEGDVTTADGTVYDNIYQGADGRYYAGANKKPKAEQSSNSQAEQKPEQLPQQSTGRWVAGLTFTDLHGRARREEFDSIQQAEKFFEEEIRKQREQLLSPGFIRIDENGEIENNQKTIRELRDLELKARNSKNVWSYQKFKTGGLADFTGPAWLDGTKAHPEIVLDAQDSRNFIQLRDILGSLLNRSTTSTSTENNGDITYDIDINVEKIDNDYDLEQVANKVKSLITDNARYRNNNAISIKR